MFIIKNTIIKNLFLSFFLFSLISCEPNERTLISQKDVCYNVNCSGNGECKDIDGKATCNCNEGYHLVDLQCLKSSCQKDEDCGLNETCSAEFKCECKPGYKNYNNKCSAFKEVIQWGTSGNDNITDMKIYEDYIYIIGNLEITNSGGRVFLKKLSNNLTIDETFYKVQGDNDFKIDSISFDKFDIYDSNIYILGTGSDQITGYKPSTISEFDLNGKILSTEYTHSFRKNKSCLDNSECNLSEFCENRICKFISETQVCSDNSPRCLDSNNLWECIDSKWHSTPCTDKKCVTIDGNDECSTNGTPQERKKNKVVNSGIIKFDNSLFYSGYFGENLTSNFINNFGEIYSYINFVDSSLETTRYIVSNNPNKIIYGLFSADMIKTEKKLAMISNLYTKISNEKYHVEPILTILDYMNDNKISKTVRDYDKNMIIHSIVENYEGDFYIVGEVVEDNNDYKDIIIIKINGNTGLSSKEYIYGSKNIVDVALKVATDPTGNLYIVGYTDGSIKGNRNIGSRDIFLSKFDKNLEHKWSTQFGSDKTDLPKEIAIDSKDNIWIVGETDGVIENINNPEKNHNEGATDIFLIKIEQEK